MMKRIIIDSQSNPLLRGSEVEQHYDQRGGLCLVGSGHIVVTLDPVHREYLDYWQELGFTLPSFLTAGPFDSRYTLSELILHKPHIQQEIHTCIGSSPARVEFSFIEAPEAELADALALPVYCGFDVALNFSRKIPFKRLCAQLSIDTPTWWFHEDQERLFNEAERLLQAGKPLLFKADDGTGGMSIGGIFEVETLEQLERLVGTLRESGRRFFLEEFIFDKRADIAVHWEITDRRELRITGFFDQISPQCTYSGVSYPSTLPQRIRNVILKQLQEQIGPYLLQQGGMGYFCCDIIIDCNEQPLWIDFHPRKGAIFYIQEMVHRLARIRRHSSNPYCWHEHLKIPVQQPALLFSHLAQRLTDLLHPSDHGPFVVITNPGVIPFGYMDITGISYHSKEEAHAIFREAVSRLQGTGEIRNRL